MQPLKGKFGYMFEMRSRTLWVPNATRLHLDMFDEVRPASSFCEEL